MYDIQSLMTEHRNEMDKCFFLPKYVFIFTFPYIDWKIYINLNSKFKNVRNKSLIVNQPSIKMTTVTQILLITVFENFVLLRKKWPYIIDKSPWYLKMCKIIQTITVIKPQGQLDPLQNTVEATL